MLQEPTSYDINYLDSQVSDQRSRIGRAFESGELDENNKWFMRLSPNEKRAALHIARIAKERGREDRLRGVFRGAEYANKLGVNDSLSLGIDKKREKISETDNKIAEKIIELENTILSDPYLKREALAYAASEASTVERFALVLSIKAKLGLGEMDAITDEMYQKYARDYEAGEHYIRPEEYSRAQSMCLTWANMVRYGSIDLNLSEYHSDDRLRPADNSEKQEEVLDPTKPAGYYSR